jgi:hypothetical protein
VRYQQSSNGQRGFLEFLELTSQLLAIFAKLLQRFIAVDKVMIRDDPKLLHRFIAVDKVMIRDDPKLHMHIALMGQLPIIILKYLAGILLPVEEILYVNF